MHSLIAWLGAEPETNDLLDFIDSIGCTCEAKDTGQAWKIFSDGINDIQKRHIENFVRNHACYLDCIFNWSYPHE